MSAPADLHTHTTYCDGKNTPAEMARAAAERGLARLGFSGHSHTAFDESYCMSAEGTRRYRAEIRSLQEEYRGRMEILCGVEQDYYSDMPTQGWDFVIGSVHYVLLDGAYVPVDEGADILRAAAEKHLGGDIYALAEAYFDTVGGVAERTGCDLIGHFDLISKFIERDALFDENHPRYVAAWQRALDRLLPARVPFEINTGAISRGYRTSPYPAPPMLEYIRARGGRLLLSSDSHAASTLCYDFSRYSHLANMSALDLTVRRH